MQEHDHHFKLVNSSNYGHNEQYGHQSQQIKLLNALIFLNLIIYRSCGVHCGKFRHIFPNLPYPNSVHKFVGVCDGQSKEFIQKC